MRQIINRAEPTSFINWKRRNINEEWSNFSGTDVYHSLREYLISAQEKMCCYCEIALKQSIDAHIEHLKSRDRFPNERFTFENLYASCQHNDSCGHWKGNNFFNEMILPIHNCSSRFTYTNNGKIIPSEENDSDALRTIELLNLNNKRLQDNRKSVIRSLQDLNDSKIFNDYLLNCVEWLNGFFSVVEYVGLKEKY